MDEKIAVMAKDLGKCYRLYEKPLDRLKQSFWRKRRLFYKEFWALKDVNFRINRGEAVGIVGSNGSGKSTLLQLICGILTPTTGQVKVNGRVAALLELGAGFNPEYTGRENIYMNGAVLGLTRDEIDKRYDQIVEFADIGPFINQPVKTYSSGMYVRLGFAVAVHVSPDILAIDEALSVGDIRFQQKCMTRLREFCENGTVIFVSHNTSAIVELCSRAIWVEQGKIVMDGKPKSVVENYVEYMYEGTIPEEKEKNTESFLAEGSIEGFVPINENMKQFGNMSVIIKGIRFGKPGANGNVVRAGEPCEIAFLVETRDNIPKPIAGFMIKDRLGRVILGENTELMGEKLPPLSKGKVYIVSFEIPCWPNLREDDYSLSVAIANGELTEHTQCHWIHDVVVFRNLAVKMPAGIFSPIDTRLELRIVEN